MDELWGPDSDTALTQAAEDSRAVLEILLMEPSVDVNRPDKYGQTALMTASYYGNSEAVKLLLRCPKTDITLAVSCVEFPHRKLRFETDFPTLCKEPGIKLTALDMAKRGDIAKDFSEEDLKDHFNSTIYVYWQKGFADIVEAFEARADLLEEGYTCDMP